MAQPGVRAGRRKSAAPLNFTLGAMRSQPIFSVSPVAFFAAGSAASSGVVASSFVVGLLELPVRLFLRAASFSVSRSSLLHSPLRRVSPVFFVRQFCAVFFAALRCRVRV